MGIQGLIGLVEKASTVVNVKQMSGSVAVIDGYGWLHRACYACAPQIYVGQHTDQYVNYCLKRTQLLIDAGIKPIVVFDGQRLPAKELTHNNRKSIRHNVKQKIELLLIEGNESKAKELMRNCIEVTPIMAKNLMNALRDKHIDYMVAPFEADAQMAYLVNNGFADFVITEDSDLLVYNCRLCLFKLDANGNGRLVDMSRMAECLGNSFDSKKFRHMAILSGCDYLPNMPGIGLQRAKKFFRMTANTDLKKVLFKVPNYLKMSKKLRVTQEYVNDFIKADNTFKYQLVFCPQRRKLIPLTPYDNEVKVEELSYAGSYFNDSLGQDFAFEYAIGNIDTKTLKAIDSFSFEPKTDSIWSKNWNNFKKKFTTNSIVLQKISTNNVLTINTINDNKCRKRDLERHESNNSNISIKRLKVNENRFIDCKQLLKEYSHLGNEDKSSSIANSTQISYISNKNIYSRNIFKVTNNKSEESNIQSKYFAEIENKKSLTSSLDSVYCETPMKIKAFSETKSSNLSQISLNSSGYTINDSTIDETLIMSDTDRSEISETSEEDIPFNRFTKIKSQKIGSTQHLMHLNSSFNSTTKKSQISQYFT